MVNDFILNIEMRITELIPPSAVIDGAALILLISVMIYTNTYRKRGHREEYTEEYYKLLEKRKSLPVWSSKKTILDLVEKNRIVIIQGETGSGKTTQIPQFLLEAGD